MIIRAIPTSSGTSYVGVSLNLRLLDGWDPFADVPRGSAHMLGNEVSRRSRHRASLFLTGVIRFAQRLGHKSRNVSGESQGGKRRIRRLVPFAATETAVC